MEDAKLIECVRARPALYDKRDKQYTNRDFTQRLWEEIASELQEQAELVKKRWAYLRDYYRKQKKIHGTTKSGMAAERKKKWPLFDAMSFLDTFIECSQTFTNVALPAPNEASKSDDETASTPSPCPEDSQEQFEPDLQPTTAAATEAEKTTVRPPPPTKKRKKRDSNEFDLKVLNALTESEKDNDPDGHLSFWKGLQPMMTHLDPLEALKFKHEVHGLLISYLERAKAKSSHVPTFHTFHPPRQGTRVQPSPTPSSVESYAQYEESRQSGQSCQPSYLEDQYYTQL